MKVAGSSVEAALSSFCGPDDIVTGTVYGHELVNEQVDYSPRNNFRLVETLTGDKALEHVRKNPQDYTALDLGPEDDLTITIMEPIYNVHTTPKALKENLPADLELDSFYKFTITRNPFDVLVSYYWWFFHAPQIIGNLNTGLEFQSRMPNNVNEQVTPYPNDHPMLLRAKFFSFLNSPITVAEGPYPSKEKTVLDWFSGWQNDFYEGIDECIRFEDLPGDFAKICGKLNLPPRKLPKLKSAQRKNPLSFPAYYNAETYEQVKSAFSGIIERFNYDCR